MGAGPRSDIQRHLVADRTTVRTRLGTRIPTVARDECLPGARGLVFKKSGEHSPSRISSRLGEIMIRHYPLHLQILNGDHLVFAYDPVRQLVQVVSSGAGNALMRAGYQSPGFVPAIRSFRLARELALFSIQVLLRPT